MGRGRVVTTVRRAIAGIELSTEFSVLSRDNFSTKGGRILIGIFVTSGPRLWNISQERHFNPRFYTVPFDSQILDFPILIIQRLQNSVNSSCGSIVIIVQEIRLRNSKNLAEIIQ